MINIKVTYNNDKNYINFRDSLLILPISLKKLAVSFDVENKGIFPYNFPSNKNLNYIGAVPAFKYFVGITQETYDNYALNFNDNWSMKEDTQEFFPYGGSQFKNSEEFNLFYSDTDSIIIDKPLLTHQVDPKLIGFMKQEKTLLEGTFIAPKVYGGILSDGSQFTKVKGFKNKVEYDQLKTLLNKDVAKLELAQEKWYKSLGKGEITIKQQIYSLQVTESKRRLIYSDDNQLQKRICLQS